MLYGHGREELAARCRWALGPLYTLVSRKFYIDEVYLFVAKGIVFDGIAAPIKWFDRRIVDGTVNAGGRLLDHGGRGVRWFQNGLLSLYLGMVVLGIGLIFLFGGLPF